MACEYINVNGVRAIVCGVRRQKRCGEPGCRGASQFQCDWKIGGKILGQKPKLCDRHLYADHATEVAADKNVCPEHHERFKTWAKARAEA